MYEFIIRAHPLLVVVLIAGYVFLIYRLRRHKDDGLQPVDVAVAQAVRISLLLVYFSGLYMSINLRLGVARVHHYASLIPVVVLFLFQFLPTIRRKSMQTKDYLYLFSALLVTVIAISLTTRMF